MTKNLCESLTLWKSIWSSNRIQSHPAVNKTRNGHVAALNWQQASLIWRTEIRSSRVTDLKHLHNNTTIRWRKDAKRHGRHGLGRNKAADGTWRGAAGGVVERGYDLEPAEKLLVLF